MATPAASRFTQATLETVAAFPACRNRAFSVEAHAVHAFGDRPPPQRFASLRGSRPLPAFDRRELVGGQLLFVDSRDSIPIERIRIPIVGTPVIMPRHMIGMARIDSLPPFEQNIGVRLRVGPIRVDWTIEPVSRESKLSAGLSL